MKKVFEIINGHAASILAEAIKKRYPSLVAKVSGDHVKVTNCNEQELMFIARDVLFIYASFAYLVIDNDKVLRKVLKNFSNCKLDFSKLAVIKKSSLEFLEGK